MPFSDASPFYPDDQTSSALGLYEKAAKLREASAHLEGQLNPQTRAAVISLMEEFNSYYSNLIEGHSTEPHEIRQALRGDFSQNPVRRNLQYESLAHIHTQRWISQQKADLKTVLSPDFIRSIHQVFCSQLPDEFLIVKGAESQQDRLIPGEFRARMVKVGRHIPPPESEVPAMVAGFCKEYLSPFLAGDRQIIAIMASHHRFVWIHPFLDGNGRVARLITDAALKAVGIHSVGVWSLSRGLARTNKQYKTLLANADASREGNLDGRGHLSQKHLAAFCSYLLDQALDQLDYISGLLDISTMNKRIEGYLNARADHRVPGVTSTVNPNAALILKYAFMAGEIPRADALRLCPGGERHARRLLKQLKEEGFLSESSSRSPLKWEIPEHAIPWYFPQLAP